MIKTAYLHIGTMKTGTSTIQEFLKINNKALYGSERIHYLGWPMRNHVKIEESLERSPENASIVISDEGLWHFGFSKRSETSKIIKLLYSKNYNVKIIVYFRRPDQFIESWYLQGLKYGKGTPLLGDFMKSPVVKSRLALNLRLGKFSKQCGKKNVIVRPFERSQLINSDVLDDFCKIIDVNIENFIRPSNENLTPNPNAIMMSRLLKGSYGIDDSSDLDEMMKVFSGVMCKEKGSILTVDEIRSIYESYESDYCDVQSNFAPHLPEKIIKDWVDPASVKLLDNSIRNIYEKYITELIE